MPKKSRITCGWPSVRAQSAKNQRIGECWSSSCSKDGSVEIIIGMGLDEPLRVLDVTVHEQIHAIVGLACGHKGDFAKLARQVGLEGKLTSTVAGAELRKHLKTIKQDAGCLPTRQPARHERPQEADHPHDQVRLPRERLHMPHDAEVDRRDGRTHQPGDGRPDGSRLNAGGNMTPDQYKDIILSLGLTQAQAAAILGVNERTSRRYALGESPIPVTVEKLLRLLLREQK